MGDVEQISTVQRCYSSSRLGMSGASSCSRLVKFLKNEANRFHILQIDISSTTIVSVSAHMSDSIMR